MKVLIADIDLHLAALPADDLISCRHRRYGRAELGKRHRKISGIHINGIVDEADLDRGGYLIDPEIAEPIGSVPDKLGHLIGERLKGLFQELTGNIDPDLDTLCVVLQVQTNSNSVVSS